MTTPKELIINALWDERRRCNLETPKGRERNEQLEAAIAWLVAQQSEIDRLKASERSAWNAAVQRDEEIDRLKAAQQKADPVEWIRVPSMDRRIGRGDDFAGDAWKDSKTGAIRHVVVGHDPNSSESKVSPVCSPSTQQKVEPVAWLYSFFLPRTGKSIQYASVCNYERRDEIADAEWAARKVMPLYAVPPLDPEGRKFRQQLEQEWADVQRMKTSMRQRVEFDAEGIALLREAVDEGGLANDLVRDRIDAYLAKYPGA